MRPKGLVVRDALSKSSEGDRTQRVTFASGATEAACSGSSSPGSSLVIPTFIGITLLVFVLIRLIPGDPIETMAGERGIDPVRHAQLRKEYGFDQPVLVQYGFYLSRLVHGDLGRSIVTHEPVISEFADLVPGDDRAVGLRDPVCAVPRVAGRHHRRGPAQLHLRSWRDGDLAHRIFDADLLVGIAADPAVFGAARMDAGLGPHRRAIFHRTGDRLPADRHAAGR